jgi:predicted metal-binding protein
MSKKSLIPPKQVICMCMGSKCKKYNKEYYRSLKDFLKENHLQHQVEILKTECTDRCKHAPVACLQPQNVWLIEFGDKEWRQNIEGLFAKKYAIET